MFKMLKNRRGLLVVEIVFLALVVTMSAITLSPPVRASFQERRAIEICEYYQGTMDGADCASAVAGMSKKEILAYIRDDGKNNSFYAQKEVSRKGGGLRARILAAQR